MERLKETKAVIAALPKAEDRDELTVQLNDIIFKETQLKALKDLFNASLKTRSGILTVTKEDVLKELIRVTGYDEDEEDEDRYSLDGEIPYEIREVDGLHNESDFKEKNSFIKEVHLIEDWGGEGQGEDIGYSYLVIFTDGKSGELRINGYYSSYDGSSYDYDDVSFREYRL